VERKLRWGVLSTANIGRAAIIPAIQNSANGELVAVASRQLDKAQAFAAGLGIWRAYGSYEALLEADDIEAVYIPLPNSLHREWTIKAAQAGKHVLCEKPLALNAEECREMEAAARQHGVRLLEAFMYRFHPRLDRTIELVRGGAIGKLSLIHSAFTFRLTRPENIRLDPELGGGALMDVGCYCVNFSRTLAGAEPIEVQAWVRWSASGVDEQMVGSLRFADGLLAQFDCALNLERRETALLAGTDGCLSLPSAFLPGKGPGDLVEQRGHNLENGIPVGEADEYQLMVEHFAQAILEDQPLRYPPAEAAANMRAITALYRSARLSGAPVLVQTD